MSDQANETENTAPVVGAAELREANGEATSDDPKQALYDAAIAALCTVYDPEIPVNIYDLGLIYDVVIDDLGTANVTMTLTAPGCPVAETFPDTIADAVRQVDGIHEVNVELTFDPPWDKDMMSEAAKLQLGMF